ncbi:MAG: hypothetical protein E7265_06725 [Lachnospiraceae bacterium]|nr:hypothetical protein [Lachnospiraceae bacterium]
MAGLKKEDKIVLETMQRALNIAEQHGVEELRREVKWRCNNQISPPGVNRNALIAIGRDLADKELKYVACSMAYTMTMDMKTPPSLVHDFLKKFNERMDIYRDDPEQFEADAMKLDADYGMQAMIKRYVEEE